MQINKKNDSQIRFDLKYIADFIKPNSKVLDIGCGDGELLYYLKHKKNVDGRGMELSHTQVSKALIKGLSVIHGNAEHDLAIYPDNSFDYAVLSQTIQATHNPPKILLEMLRIAKYGIVSLPNFAHLRNRCELMFMGKMPVNKAIPFQWYETPNIHFCSIIDFENLCKDLDLTVKKRLYLTNNHKLMGVFAKKFLANMLARFGIFLITKNELMMSGDENFVLKNILAMNYKTAQSNLFSKEK